MKRLWSALVTRINHMRGKAATPAGTTRTAPAPRTAPKAAPSRVARPAPPAKPGPKVRTAPKPAAQSSAPPLGRQLAYAPQKDGRADPGEIVWTWVEYEDDPNQGKDRPVLVVGREGATLLGLMLSSQQERDGQRNWLGLGAGDWDGSHRPSWVRLDRVLRVKEDGIRREGAILDRARFDTVATALRTGYGWR